MVRQLCSEEESGMQWSQMVGKTVSQDELLGLIYLRVTPVTL